MANILPDDIDFNLYSRETEAKTLVRPASSWHEDLRSRLRSKTTEKAVSLANGGAVLGSRKPAANHLLVTLHCWPRIFSIPDAQFWRSASERVLAPEDTQESLTTVGLPVSLFDTMVAMNGRN